MKRVIVIISLLLVVYVLVGCVVKSKKEPNKETPRAKDSSQNTIGSLLNKLEETGYYKYIDSSKIGEVKKASLDAEYVFGWEDSGRDFSTDAESLAEGGISEFYNSIKEFMKKQNVDIVEIEDFSDKGYTIQINGEKYVIYNEEELNSKDIWQLSTIRSFAIINKLLKDANSSERLYILYGGNDLRGVFLTDDMYKVIIDSNLLPKKELPEPVAQVF